MPVPGGHFRWCNETGEAMLKAVLPFVDKVRVRVRVMFMFMFMFMFIIFMVRLWVRVRVRFRVRGKGSGRGDFRWCNETGEAMLKAVLPFVDKVRVRVSVRAR